MTTLLDLALAFQAAGRANDAAFAELMARRTPETRAAWLVTASALEAALEAYQKASRG